MPDLLLEIVRIRKTFTVSTLPFQKPGLPHPIPLTCHRPPALTAKSLPDQFVSVTGDTDFSRHSLGFHSQLKRKIAMFYDGCDEMLFLFRSQLLVFLYL